MVQNKRHKIDSIFSSQIQVDMQKWRNAISSEENWMRHREKNFKLHISGPKTPKIFMDHISSACRLPGKKLSSEEIADEIAARTKKDSEMW